MKLSMKALPAGALLSLLISGSSFAVVDTNLGLTTTLAGTPPASSIAPAVNVLFRDFSDAAPGAYGSFEWIRNTIEVQVTTGSALYDDPGGTCCAVQGRGNLSGNERLQGLLLNVNPALDLSKLQVYWVGDPMPPGPAGSNTFPAAGAKPISIARSTNLFGAGAGGAYDVSIVWGNGGLGPAGDAYSKLLLVYNGSDTDISAADFLRANNAGYLGAGLVSGANGVASTIIVAVPEPQTYALLGIGVLGLFVAVRRERRTGSKSLLRNH